MTRASADAVLDRMENDEDFAVRVRDAGGQAESLRALQSEGFDVTPEELRDALVDRYGDNLTQEQLDAVAGGISDVEYVVAAGTSLVIVAAVAATV